MMQRDEQDEQFMILEALTPQEELKLNQERKRQLEEFYSTNKTYQISNWYQELQPFTFKSVNMQLTSIDAYLLYWLYYHDQNIHLLQTQHPQLHLYYTKLLHKIDSFLNSYPQIFNKTQQTHSFMKLSTRSPKDLGYKYTPNQISTISSHLTSYLKNKFPSYCHQQDNQQPMKSNQQSIKIKCEYKNSLQQTNLNQQPISTKQQNQSFTSQINTQMIRQQPQLKQLSKQLINQIYRYFLQMSKQKFKIKSSLDFINIFSSSQRIIIDISDFSFIQQNVFEQFQKGNYERADDKFIQVWGRQWQDFQWYEEFRCFYHNYKLTGITQYDQRCYFPQIKLKSHLIEQQITKFFNSMLPSLMKLGLSEGVMDLVLFGISSQDHKDKQQTMRVKLIEINVFNRNSRASLFSWDRDFDTLTNKIQKPLEIRLLQQPIKISKYQLIKLMGMIDKGTHQIITQSMKQLELLQQWNNFQ